MQYKFNLFVLYVIYLPGLYAGSWNGVVIYAIVDPKCRGLGAQSPATVAYLTKDNPENSQLTHTTISAINYIIPLYFYKNCDKLSTYIGASSTSYNA